MRVTPAGVTQVVVGEPTLVLVGEPIFTPSSNPALRGVNLEVVGEPTLSWFANHQVIDFGDKNLVNSSNFNDTIPKFSQKFNHRFSHVFRFVNMFPESPSFAAVPVTRSNNLVSLP